jgi:hypothetical protein
VVGAPYVDIAGGTDAGLAYLYKQPPSGWADATQDVTLETAGASAGDFSAGSVAIDGTTVVVSSAADDTHGKVGSGAAYVFNDPISHGTALARSDATLTAPDPAAGNGFGAPVVIQGRHIAVGELGLTIGTTANAGAAYLFTKPAGAWTSSHAAAKLTPPHPTSDEYYGSVALDGRDLAVGAADAGAKQQGETYLYAPARPTISGLGESKKRWKLGHHKPAINPSHKPHGGAKFSFRLNEAAKVTLTFAERHHHHYRTVGTVTFAAKAGKQRVYIDGRLRHDKRLRAGKCNVSVTAHNANGAVTSKALHFATH